MPIPRTVKAKTLSSVTDLSRFAVRAPNCVPSRIPIANGMTYSMRTFPNKMCVETPEIDVNIIVSIDVATAMCTGNPTNAINIGTTMSPPSIPKNPEAKPPTKSRIKPE